MANIDGTSERISDHDLRVIGVYGFRDLLRQESDTWLNHSPEGGRAEHIVSKFEEKLNRAELEVKKNDFRSVLQLVGQFNLHEDNKFARRQLCQILLHAEIEVFRLIKEIVNAGTLIMEPQDKFYSYDDFLDHLSKRQPDVLTSSQTRNDEHKTFGTKSTETKHQTAANFPSPPDLKWDEVTITFFQDDAVKIKAQNVEKKFTFAEMGFKDGRKGDAPNSRWDMLRDGFAVRGGAIKWEDDLPQTEKVNLKKTVSDIGSTLKLFFNMTDGPFQRYHSSRGYNLKLTLLDHRSGNDHLPLNSSSESETLSEEIENEFEAEANRWLDGSLGNRRIGNLSKKKITNRWRIHGFFENNRPLVNLHNR